MARTLILPALLLLTCLAYGSVRTADFVYEDRNPVAALDARVPLDNRGPWAGWAVERLTFWPQPRMLTNVTTRLQGWAHASARGYHLGNLAVHLVNGVLLWLVLAPIGATAAAVGTLLFLLHPINHEAVAYVSARPDLLYATGVLLLLLASEADGWDTPIWVTLAAALAVLAKESAIVVVGLLPVWLLFRRRWAPYWWVTVAGTVGIGLGVVYRLVHVSAREGAARPWGAIAAYTADAAHGWLAYAAVQSAALWRLLALLVWPRGFSIDHDFDVVPVWLGVVSLAALVALIVIAACRWRRWPLAAFAVAWLTLSLGLRFLVPMPEYLHEQHLYVPLLGVWIGLAVGCERSPLARIAVSA